jgi:tRNA-Thr(GGU) m(6)t(6)A37 methyltransferase TsaA
MDLFRLFSVGKVKKDSNINKIEIHKEYVDALLGLDQFSHVIVLYWLHKNDTPEKRSILRVHPRHNMNNPLTGVFACHSPCRPNVIGLSICKILSIKGNIIYIDSIDAFNDSPVLDLKSYIPSTYNIQNAFIPEWASQPKL